MIDMQTFFDSCHEKFLLRATGECHICKGTGTIQERSDWDPSPCERCKGTGKFNRSLTPWSHHDWNFLMERLADEVKEWNEHPFRLLDGITDAAADELLDIANFACFLWLKWKGDECKHEFAYLFDLAEHQQCKHCKVTKGDQT